MTLSSIFPINFGTLFGRNAVHLEMVKLHKFMRTTRSRYHYAIRYVKKNEEIMRKEAMAQSISENNSRDLWKEVHKVRDKI